MTENSPTPNLTQRWFLAIRPKTLPAAVAPVLLGWSIAAQTGVFRIGAALAALAVAVLIQIATNLVNDVVDFGRGADTEQRSGPIRVTETGLLTQKQVWAGVWVTFGLAALCGIYLTWLEGWVVLVLGAASIIAGIAYTAGPFPLAYNGLGDLFVMLFFGYVCVVGTVLVVSGSVPPTAWYGATAAGALTVNILVINNIRDIDSDRQAGRKNLPIVFGRKAAEWEYGLMLALAYATPLALWVTGMAGPWTMLSWVSLPQAVKLWGVLRNGESGAALNPLLGKTAQVLLRYCVLLGAGILLSTM